MSTHCVDKKNPKLGYYQISQTADQVRWVWRETAKGIAYEEHGPWFSSAVEAYRDAASDWDDNGDGSNKRLSGQLRAAATRAEKIA